MILLNRSVTFRHGILGSECHVLTLYSWIGVSRFDTIILKEKYVELKWRYSISKNSTPKMVWFGGMSPHVWSWYRWLNTWLLYCYWHLIVIDMPWMILWSSLCTWLCDCVIWLFGLWLVWDPETVEFIFSNPIYRSDALNKEGLMKII